MLLSLALYLPPYKDAFIGDDYLQLSYVAEFLQHPWRVVQVFHPLWTTWYYRPLQNVWLLLNRLAFGLNPFGYYYLQALWHALVVCSIYALARRLGVRTAGALLAAAFFAVNAHHHDVVAWISSIAIIMATLFSVLAMATYATYVRNPRDRAHLLATTILTLLAMFTHEEGLLLLPLLIVMRLVFYRRRPLRRGEKAAGGLLLALMLALIVVQFVRPNSTISLQEQSATTFLSYAHPYAVANYVVTVAGRWLLLNKSAPGLQLLQAIRQIVFVEIIFGAGILYLFARWYRRGSNTIRVGVAWVALHLGFLYVAVWTQKPEFFAGRHLYNAWAALTVALGAAGGAYLTPGPRQVTFGPGRRALVSILAAFLALNCLSIGADQRAWRQHERVVADAARQMKQQVPQVTAQTEMYAHRFVLEPSFTAAAAAVWYREPGLSGGSLRRLRTQERVTANTYVWDYEEGRLYNVIPAFQEHAQTVPLWQPAAATIVGSGRTAASRGTYTLDRVGGPTGERRLGLLVEPPAGGWLSLAYTTTVPQTAVFVVDVWADPGAAVRLRIERHDSEPVTIDTVLVTAPMAQRWQTLTAPLQAYWGQRVTMRLEVQGVPREPVFLTVPRFALTG